MDAGMDAGMHAEMQRRMAMIRLQRNATLFTVAVAALAMRCVPIVTNLVYGRRTVSSQNTIHLSSAPGAGEQ